MGGGEIGQASPRNAFRFSVRIFNQTVSTVEIVFSDNGKGIAPLDLEHVFDKYRPKQEAISEDISAISHLGIGLYIVKMIAELHNGCVSATSELGKGSKFFLEFPYGV